MTLFSLLPDFRDGSLDARAALRQSSSLFLAMAAVCSSMGALATWSGFPEVLLPALLSSCAWLAGYAFVARKAMIAPAVVLLAGQVWNFAASIEAGAVLSAFGGVILVNFLVNAVRAASVARKGASAA